MSRFRYLLYTIMSMGILLLIYIFLKQLLAGIIISIFIVVNMIIASYKRFLKIPVEIELLTLGIVVSTYRYGIKAGLVVAILGGILSFIVGLNFSPFSFPMLLGYMITALVSYQFRYFNISVIGILATLASNAFIFTIYHFVFDYDIFKNLSFSISNIIINSILFLNLAPLLI